jgi:hypothetical protein
LTIINQIILKVDCLVIPLESHKDILNRIDASHLGIKKTKQQACYIVFWSGMTKDIEDHIKHCYSCTKFQLVLDNIHNKKNSLLAPN